MELQGEPQVERAAVFVWLNHLLSSLIQRFRLTQVYFVHFFAFTGFHYDRRATTHYLWLLF